MIRLAATCRILTERDRWILWLFADEEKDVVEVEK